MYLQWYLLQFEAAAEKEDIMIPNASKLESPA